MPSGLMGSGRIALGQGLHAAVDVGAAMGGALVALEPVRVLPQLVTPVTETRIGIRSPIGSQ